MSEMGQAVMGAGRAQGEDRAIMAVHSAIGSPLLEDINLSGARGVLVNITAGMNLTMKEFDEVGSAVADLASDDATVVIGTVIDPEIGDELRVTVVATGLGESNAYSQPCESSLQLVRNGSTGQAEPMYMEETGSVVVSESIESETAVETSTDDMFSRQENIDYLDIPSFLRIQAD
jgi:cell division protein FtsZ